MESMAKHDFRALIADALADADLDPTDVGLTVDDEGRIVLVLDGLTLDDHERVVKVQREYEVEVQMTVLVTIGVTAPSEEDAREQVEAGMMWSTVEVDFGDLEVHGVEQDDADIRSVDLA